MDVAIIQAGHDRLSLRLDHPCVCANEPRNFLTVSNGNNFIAADGNCFRQGELRIDRDHLRLPNDEIGRNCSIAGGIEN